MIEKDIDFKEVSNSRRSDDIIMQIREAIRTEALKPGDKLPTQREMMSKFNTSIRTVREALNALENMGLVKVKRGAKGGAFIKKPDSKEVRKMLDNVIQFSEIPGNDLKDFREGIEALSASFCAKKVQKNQIDRLLPNAHQFESLIHGQDLSTEEILIQDLALHRQIAKIGGNSLLMANLNLIHDKIKHEFLKKIVPMSKLEIDDCLEDWQLILNALQKNQIDKFNSLIRTHVRKINRIIFEDEINASDHSVSSTNKRAPISESNQEAILLFAGAALTPKSKKVNHHPQVEKWKFPALSWWTGEWGNLGEEAKLGIDAAVEDINSQGGIRGIPVDISWHNTEYSISKTQAHFNKILPLKPLVIIGPQSDVPLSCAAPIAAREKVFILSGASDNVPFIDSYPWGSALMTTIEGITQAAAKFWYERHKNDVTSVALFPNTVSLAVERQAETWEKTLRENGLKTVKTIEVLSNRSDYGSIVRKAMDFGADAFININQPDQGGKIAVELYKNGVRDGWRVVHYLCTDLPELYQIGEGYLENNYVYNIIDINHKGKRWGRLLNQYRHWRQDSQARPSYLLPFAYDIPFIIKQAFEDLKITGNPENIDKERALIRDYILDLKDFQGIQGPISVVKGTGGACRPLFYYKIADNQPQLISTVPTEMILP